MAFAGFVVWWFPGMIGFLTGGFACVAAALLPRRVREPGAKLDAVRTPPA